MAHRGGGAFPHKSLLKATHLRTCGHRTKDRGQRTEDRGQREPPGGSPQWRVLTRCHRLGGRRRGSGWGSRWRRGPRRWPRGWGTPGRTGSRRPSSPSRLAPGEGQINILEKYFLCKHTIVFIKPPKFVVLYRKTLLITLNLVGTVTTRQERSGTRHILH